jgi:hypothetical protein
VRVFFGIAVSMVHSVKNCISARRKERRALRKPGKDIEEFFPKFVHVEHFMSAVTVQEEGLTK